MLIKVAGGHKEINEKNILFCACRMCVYVNREMPHCKTRSCKCINPLTPNDLYMSRNALLTSKRCILYIYSTNVGTEYFKHALYSAFFSLQNAVCFVMLTCLVC